MTQKHISHHTISETLEHAIQQLYLLDKINHGLIYDGQNPDTKDHLYISLTEFLHSIIHDVKMANDMLMKTPAS